MPVRLAKQEASAFCFAFANILKNVIIFSQWPYRLTVRTRPFQGCNPGSIPGKVTNQTLAQTKQKDF